MRKYLVIGLVLLLVLISGCNKTKISPFCEIKETAFPDSEEMFTNLLYNDSLININLDKDNILYGNISFILPNPCTSVSPFYEINDKNISVIFSEPNPDTTHLFDKNYSITGCIQIIAPIIYNISCYLNKGNYNFNTYYFRRNIIIMGINNYTLDETKELLGSRIIKIK